MSIRKSIIVFVTLILCSTSCGVETRPEVTSTQAPLIITSTLPVTLTSQPSETPLPATSQPTLAPAEGTTSTQVNVRAEPSTASNVLGIIPANIKVEITGKDPGESWWQINYPQGIDGKGWVTAQYITTANKPGVPVVGGADPSKGNVAVVQQQLNVRSGPGTSFNSLGTLNPQDVVSLTGKDSNGAWLQIDFPAGAGPEGKGWVNAAFVQVQGVDLSGLPIVTEAGQVVGTGTPTGIPPTSTATLIPAWEDNDTADQPIASVIFELTGTQTFIYNGDLSSPQGDSEDWIGFTPYGVLLFVSLECAGSKSLRLEIMENNLPTDLMIACGDQMRKITVKAGLNYLIHLQATPNREFLQYTKYTLIIKAQP